MTTRYTDSLHVGVSALRANPLRTILSTLGVVMGVGSMVSVLAIGDGVERLGREQVAGTTNILAVVVRPLRTQRVDGVEVARPDTVTFRPADVAALDAEIPEIEYAFILRRAGGLIRRDSAGSARGVNIIRTQPALFRSRAMVPGHGALFTDEDVAASRNVIVVTAAVADTIAPGIDHAALIGTTVLVQDRPFTVVGVLQRKAADVMQVFVPLDALSAGSGPRSGSSDEALMAYASSVEGAGPMRTQIESSLARRLGASWKERVLVASDSDRLDQARRGFLIFRLLMGSITGISLLVGGIGIMNVLLAAVTERTREIGIRKAAGARHGDILRQFLAESVAITGAGALVGVVLGIAIAYASASIMRHMGGGTVYASVTPGTIAIAAIAAVVVGLGFGLYPALRAARLSPIDAIRHE